MRTPEPARRRHTKPRHAAAVLLLVGAVSCGAALAAVAPTAGAMATPTPVPIGSCTITAPTPSELRKTPLVLVIDSQNPNISNLLTLSSTAEQGSGSDPPLIKNMNGLITALNHSFAVRGYFIGTANPDRLAGLKTKLGLQSITQENDLSHVVIGDKQYLPKLSAAPSTMAIIIGSSSVMDTAGDSPYKTQSFKGLNATPTHLTSSDPSQDWSSGVTDQLTSSHDDLVRESPYTENLSLSDGHTELMPTQGPISHNLFILDRTDRPDGAKVSLNNTTIFAHRTGVKSVQCQDADDHGQLTFPIKIALVKASSGDSISVSTDANDHPAANGGNSLSLPWPIAPQRQSAQRQVLRVLQDERLSKELNDQCSPDKPLTRPPGCPKPEITTKSKSPSLRIAGGSLAGLLVGAGAGAALMAKWRKDDDDPRGRNMSGSQPPTGSPPFPNGAVLGGPTGVPAPRGSDLSSGGGASPIGPVASTVPVATAVGGRLAPPAGAAVGTHEWTVAAPGGGTVRLEDIGVDRLMPTATEHGRVWAVGNPSYAATAGWLEKRKGKGEDAEPTLRVHKSGRGIIGVYDGTGGAGASVARTTGDGRDLSAAYVAARLVRDVVEAWFVDAVDSGDRALESAGLAATLHRVLSEEAQYLPSVKSAVRGSLHRVLPTTAACIAFDASDPAGTVDALWAGDSRCFLLTPAKGLQALSRDDTRESDALALIRNDQPMENLVAADRPFRINHRRFTPERPSVLLTATDGAFGYVRTPAHFEFLLLHALVTADTIDQWSDRLLGAFAEFAADDVSFSIAATGFPSVDELKQAFQPRHDYLQAEHWQPFVDNTGDSDAIERLREESWSVYRDLYQARLAGPDAAISAEARPEGQ